MKWPWRRPAEPRGTVTFLADGRVLIGIPSGRQFSKHDVQAIRQGVAGWLASATQRTIVLPFPVDVIDQRPKP